MSTNRQPDSKPAVRENGIFRGALKAMRTSIPDGERVVQEHYAEDYGALLAQASLSEDLAFFELPPPAQRFESRVCPPAAFGSNILVASSCNLSLTLKQS